MIFWKNEAGNTAFIGGPTEDGGFFFMDGPREIELTREECYQVVMVLIHHFFKIGKENGPH